MFGQIAFGFECKIAIFVAGGIIAALVVGGFIYKLYKLYISCQNKKKAGIDQPMLF